MTWNEVKWACQKVVGPCPECGGKLTVSITVPRPEPGSDQWGCIGVYCCHGATSIKESEAMGYTKDNAEYFDSYSFAFPKVILSESELMDMVVKAAANHEQAL